MGKRELLLIVGFALLATVVYVATAPEQADGGARFAFGKLVDNIRREVRGNQASTEMTTTESHALAGTTSDTSCAGFSRSGISRAARRVTRA